MTQPSLFTLNPHQVTTPSGRVALVVANVSEGVPRPVLVRCAATRGMLRFAGNSSVTSIANQTSLLEFVREAFGSGKLSNLALMSGGTRIVDGDHQVVMTILELPQLIRSMHPSCLTLGSVPRTTESMSLIGPHSTFIPGDTLDGTTLAHPGLDVLWIVQTNASQTSGYELDVPLYFDLMDLVRDEDRPTGLFVWGGGAITAEEIRQAIIRKHPCAVAGHSGRFATSLFMWVNGAYDEVDAAHVSILKKWAKEKLDLSWVDLPTTPEEMITWLDAHGFYAS